MASFVCLLELARATALQVSGRKSSGRPATRHGMAQGRGDREDVSSTRRFKQEPGFRRRTLGMGTGPNLVADKLGQHEWGRCKSS